MNRRDFLQASVGSGALAILPFSVKAKPKMMTVEAFCRDVLKVELYSWQKKWVLYTDRLMTARPQYFTDRTFHFVRGVDVNGWCKGRTFLAACVALWAAYTHPERTVWWHGDENDFWDAVYVEIQKRHRNDKLWSEEIYNLAYKISPWICNDLNRETSQPGDWHVFVYSGLTD